MKIPTILAQPVSVGVPAADVGASGAAGTYQIAQGIGHLGAVAEELAHIQRQQQAQQDRDSALDITSTAAQKAEALREGAKLPKDDNNPHGVPEGEAPSQTYIPRYLKAYDEMARETVQQAPNEQTKRLVNNTLLRLRGETSVQVTKDQFALYKDEQLAGVPTRLETFRSQIIGNPGQRETLTQARNEYIDSLTHLTTSQKEKMRLEETQKTELGIGQRAIDQRPFDPIGDYAARLSPENYLKLTYHQEARQKQAIAFQDKVDREAAKNVKEMQEAVVDDYESKANRGELTIDMLEKAREDRTVTGENYRRLAKRVLEEKDVPDIPAERERILMGVRGMNPTVTENDIRASRGANKISLKTATEAMDTLRITKNALKSETNSDLVRAHNQAEQMLRANLGIGPGLIAPALGESPSGRLYAIGLDELTRRSALFKDSYGGSEDPLKVMEEIGPRYKQSLMETNNNKVLEIQKVLRFQTPQQLEEAKRAGAVNQSQYFIELRKFSEIDRLMPKAPAVNVPKTGGGESKPSQGNRLEYKPGG